MSVSCVVLIFKSGTPRLLPYKVLTFTMDQMPIHAHIESLYILHKFETLHTAYTGCVFPFHSRNFRKSSCFQSLLKDKHTPYCTKCKHMHLSRIQKNNNFELYGEKPKCGLPERLLPFVNLTDPQLLPKLRTVSFIGRYKSIFSKRAYCTLDQVISSLTLTLLICTCPMGHHSSVYRVKQSIVSLK